MDLLALSGPLTLASEVVKGGADPFTYLTGLGFPGIIILLLIMGWLVPKGVVERMAKDLDKKDDLIALKDQQIQALQSGLVERALPAITRSTQILEQLPRTMTSGQSAVLEQITSVRQEAAELARKLEFLGDGPNE